MRFLPKIAELRNMSPFKNVQNGVLWFLGFVVVATLLVYPEARVRAPLLTVTGAAMFLVPVVPTGKIELPQIATLLGTLVALFGGWYWVSDATGGEPGITVATVV